MDWKMIVALHIISESSDHYTELFVNKTVEEIKTELYDGMDWFAPVGDYHYAFDDDTTDVEEKEVQQMLSQWSSDSWNHETSEDDEEDEDY
jgi:hypothetical protein